MIKSCFYLLFCVPVAVIFFTAALAGCGDDKDKVVDSGTPPELDGGWIPEQDGGPDGGIPEDLDWSQMSSSTYTMGTATDAGLDTSQEVTISNFEIMKKEVTTAQYLACIASGRCSEPDAAIGCNWNEVGYDEHPINCVSWQQSADFCVWIGARLPSESEWEYAARSMGEANTYPWGEAAPSCDLAVTLLDGSDGASGGCGTNRTFAVCSKTAGNTEQELCDMAGNAGEWVQDKYLFGYAHIPMDGSAYESSGAERVFRGGAFASPQLFLETTNRNGHIDPDFQTENLGFRCVR